MPCKINYHYSIQPPTIFFKHSGVPQTIDIAEIEAADCWYMSIDTINDTDFEFIKTLMTICARNNYDYFFVASKNLQQSVVDYLCESATNIFTTYSTPHETKLVFSIDTALQHILRDNTYIGTFVKDYGLIFPQPINGGTFKYIDIIKILSYADKIVEEITSLELSAVQKIVWIDNWFQANIQYIKDRITTSADGKKYICKSITKVSSVPDVFINHYGVCEDIATSIAIILRKLQIKCDEIQVDGHAWLFVELDHEYYLWDCTRNITRNNCLASNGIKATAYFDKYTLRGKAFCEHEYKYDAIDCMPQLSVYDYPRDKINDAIVKLKQKNVSFIYPSSARYNSSIEQ